MIQPQDLRIGSILSTKTVEGSRSHVITAKDILDAERDVKAFNFAYDAIELTEDVLMSCGFSDVTDQWPWITIGKDGLIAIGKSGDVMLIDGLDDFVPDNKILYLHELQDLFRILTGKELQINLEKLNQTK